jgi:serpin B
MIRLPPFRSAGFLLAASLLGCGTESPVKPVDPMEVRKLAPEIEADAQALVEGNNRFAFDLYSQLRTQTGNLFLSPYSVSTAFGMASAGAAGQTQEEMTRVLHFPPQEKLHPTFGALQRSLDRGTQCGGYELRIANRAWGQSGFPFVQAFLDVTREHYGAEMQQADFQHGAEAARQVINGWVEQQTNSKIRDLFPAGSIDQNTRLVLANAIYFKGLWARQFDRSQTTDAAFHLSASEVVSVPTMRREDKFRLARAEGVQMLELPYKGEDLSMLILLPDRIDGLADLEAGLSPERLRALLDGLSEHEVPVKLPRFKIASKFELPRVLSTMGMPSAFAPGEADFSAMDGRRDLYISAAYHQAFVEVNEEGTEAAAATGIGVGITSVPPSFTADHPFLFLIRDNVTGSILFLGRVADPRS